ncbi:hypothetical protein N2W54_001454 [Lotmaria passim]
MAQLFIGQLPFSKFFPDDLLNLFRPYGNVVAHQLHIRQGNAFVTYATTDEADAAIRTLHGNCTLGTRSQPIQVMYSKGTRLISAFGLQHRSLCLARNKDRQRSKEVLNSTANAGNNNDSVSLNDGAMVGAQHQNVVYSSNVLYSTGAEEVSTNGNVSAAGVASFASRGLSDVSFDEESRQLMSSGAFSNASVHSLNACVTRQVQQQQQQQQQQAYLSSLIGVDPLLCGSSAKWAVTPSTLMMPATATPRPTNSGSTVLSPPSPLRLSSPASPPPPSLSYVVMPPSSAQAMAAGFGMPVGMPLCYVMPTAAAEGSTCFSQLHTAQAQLQQGVYSVVGPCGATTMLSPLAYMQMRPM